VEWYWNVVVKDLQGVRPVAFECAVTRRRWSVSRLTRVALFGKKKQEEAASSKRHTRACTVCGGRLRQCLMCLLRHVFRWCCHSAALRFIVIDSHTEFSGCIAAIIGVRTSHSSPRRDQPLLSFQPQTLNPSASIPIPLRFLPNGQLVPSLRPAAQPPPVAAAASQLRLLHFCGERFALICFALL